MLSCLETLVDHVMFLKGLIAARFESSEPGVSAPSPREESTDYLIKCFILVSPVFHCQMHAVVFHT